MTNLSLEADVLHEQKARPSPALSASLVQKPAAASGPASGTGNNCRAAEAVCKRHLAQVLQGTVATVYVCGFLIWPQAAIQEGKGLGQPYAVDSG